MPDSASKKDEAQERMTREVRKNSTSLCCNPDLRMKVWAQQRYQAKPPEDVLRSLRPNSKMMPGSEGALTQGVRMQRCLVPPKVEYARAAEAER